MATVGYPTSSPEAHVPPAPPPINSLPVEVLSTILSLVLLSFKDHRFPKRLPDSPFHVLRSTCRRFREISDQLPFWYTVDFDFNQEDRVVFAGRYPDESTVEVLLSDRHLQLCLSSKTSWRVS